MTKNDGDTEHDTSAPSGSAAAGHTEASGQVVPLERPIQEHLGKQLRSTYNVMTEKPTFLGDPAVPPQFDGLIQKLEARDRQRTEAIHDKGVAAVEGALQEALRRQPDSQD